MLTDCLYTGLVYHSRHYPTVHAFTYPIYFYLLDLKNIERKFINPINIFKKLSFCRTDYYLGKKNTEDLNKNISHSGSLFETVQHRLLEENPKLFPQKIYMLTHLRNAGFNFNPVTFYFAFTADGKLSQIMSEITNTPWRQRSAYVHTIRADAAELEHSFWFNKDFHVSPFHPMDVKYNWKFDVSNKKIKAHMDLYKDGQHIFEAGINLSSLELNEKNITYCKRKYPFMPLKGFLLIYWHALKLWIKGVPFHSNPHISNGGRK